jgi:tetratricopeptide (TPR) repeat protein
MESNTVPRWTTYPEYIRFGLRLVDLVKRLSPGLWSFREPHELAEIEDPAAPLYADELAFLYNDVGLTLCAEGYMPDTLAVWEQGFEINRILEGTAAVPWYTLQSQLHLGHTFLELGNLPLAAQYLDETARTNHKVRDQDYRGRIVGYQALISYYRGYFEEADAMFGEALGILKWAGGNARAQSFFLSHRAKLAMVIRDFDKAAEYVASSRALAASGRAEDLLAYARTAEGRLHRELGAFAKANAEYHAALAEAHRLGIRRLEAEILTGLSRLALSLEDAALARRRSMAALGISNELGLGLRQTQSMLVLGVATARTGQAQLGRSYLRLAKRLGGEQEYWLRSREAEEHLQKLGEDSSGRGL